MLHTSVLGVVILDDFLIVHIDAFCIHHRVNSKMMKLVNAAELAPINFDANWAFLIITLISTALILVIRTIKFICTVVGERCITLNLNRPNQLGKVVIVYIIDFSPFQILRSRSDYMIKWWESHFLRSTILENDCIEIRIAILWVIVHSDRIWGFSSINHCNFRKYGICCPTFQSFFTLSTFLFAIICEQCAITSSSTLWLAEFEISILITFITTDVCESAIYEIINCPGLVFIRLIFLIC